MTCVVHNRIIQIRFVFASVCGQTAQTQYSSASSNFSGRCLCLALRPAGLAFGSGLAMLSGCPGGASGRRIEPMMDGFRFPRFDCEDFMDVVRGAISRRNASCAARDCQSVRAT
jgi:hypothetical protein